MLESVAPRRAVNLWERTVFDPRARSSAPSGASAVLHRSSMLRLARLEGLSSRLIGPSQRHTATPPKGCGRATCLSDSPISVFLLRYRSRDTAPAASDAPRLEGTSIGRAPARAVTWGELNLVDRRAQDQWQTTVPPDPGGTA